MAIKFDDISKVATSVHKDDFHTAGLQLKTKLKTSYQNSVLSTQVDLFDEKAATPAKLTFVWPKPLGFKKAFIDKLEVDKAGKFKLEASSADVYPGLMLEAKSDLTSVNKVGFTYTDYQETRVQFECEATDPKDFTCETTYKKDKATFGLKLNSSILKGGLPDAGVRFQSGPFFCALLATGSFKAYNASLFYKQSDAVKGAVTYQHGGKANGSFTVGVAYKDFAKVKVDQSQTVACSYKHTLSKGFTVLGGLSYNLPKADAKWGVQLSIA